VQYCTGSSEAPARPNPRLIAVRLRDPSFRASFYGTTRAGSPCGFNADKRSDQRCRSDAITAFIELKLSARDPLPMSAWVTVFILRNASASFSTSTRNRAMGRPKCVYPLSGRCHVFFSVRTQPNRRLLIFRLHFPVTVSRALFQILDFARPSGARTKRLRLEPMHRLQPCTRRAGFRS
jgi:hypothetical protein